MCPISSLTSDLVKFTRKNMRVKEESKLLMNINNNRMDQVSTKLNEEKITRLPDFCMCDE